MTDTSIKQVAYSGPDFQAIADEHTVLRGQVGSGLHGVTTGADDRDEMGVCIEPPAYVIGNSRFEQYQHRTQPEGVRSGPGDLDLVVYSLRKWARLAAAGNPTVLLLLFLPADEIVVNTWVGRELQENPELFISRDAGRRFIGYLESQRDQMLGIRGRRHTNRPELVEVHGFDTKFAYHAVRLGLQGVELLSTGSITLPIPEPDRTWLRELRNGEHTLDEALNRMADLKDELSRLTHHSAWPKTADSKSIDLWLTETYQSWWDEKGLI